MYAVTIAATRRCSSAPSPAARQAAAPGAGSWGNGTAAATRARACSMPAEPTSGATAPQAQGSTPGKAAKWRQIRLTSGMPEAARISA